MNKFKELLEKAGDLQFIKKAKDYIALHKIAAVTTATTAAAGENIKCGREWSDIEITSIYTIS